MPSDPLAAVRDPLRLESLRTTGLLDTPAEEAFDRFGRLASRMLNTPIALVSLVDADRQYFKSCLGLAEPWSRWRETPLSHSYCQHVVATRTALMIEDARTHALTAGSLAINDLGAISYLGVPLTLRGHVLGSFCVIDKAPRRWTAEDVETVDALAAGVLREIEIRAAEEEAARARALGYYQALVERAPDLIAVVNSDGILRYVSPSVQPMLGYSDQEIVGRSLFDLLHPDDVGLVREEFVRAAEKPGYTASAVVRFRSRSGAWRLLEGVGCNAVHDPQVGGVIFNCRDVTESRARDEALRRATLQLEHVLAVVPAFLYSLRAEDFAPVWIGGNIAGLLGYRPEEALATPNWWADRIHPEDREQAFANQATLRQVGHLAHTYRFRHADGSYRWIRDELAVIADAAGAPAEIGGLWVDVTEQKRLEETVRQSDRMSALGRLAAGVAHELRNPLGVILGRVDLLGRAIGGAEAPDKERVDRNLTSLREASERMKHIVESLSVYAKPPRREPQALDVGRLFESIRELIAHAARSGRITVGTDVQPETPPLLGDRSQVMQILLNLATNAIEAMSDAGGGELKLRAGRGAHGGPDIEIADTGPGIPQAKLALIWEPFYTTKREGTGLGLALVRSLVAEQPGAAIDVHTEPGRGTSFRLMFSSTAPNSAAGDEAAARSGGDPPLTSPRLDANPASS
jgi:PAS domain S-box-containing protein